MTKKKAEDLGYAVIKASHYEVGLIKENTGVRTWWARDFNGKLPSLDHPLIQKAIEIHEGIEE